MAARWLETLGRVLDAPLPRRAAARVLTRFGLAATLAPLGAAASTGNDKKRKTKKKPKFNEFGCVNVGQLCLESGQC
ncbi:MAG: hypothetical protein U0031_23690 [Thermomicrobiales bacterium]